ncbi:MAG: cytochrome c biogenesis protein CcsA [Bacteroidales bacterium]
MMNWSNFYIFSGIAIVFWILASIISARSKKKSSLAIILSIIGTAIFGTFLIGLWIELKRPPLKTMGETRMWYSFFMSIAGCIIYYLWKYRAILSFTTLMASVFIMINLLKPETLSSELLPALQSPWFIPHVVVYMIAYAFLGAAFMIGILLLFKRNNQLLLISDNLVSLGLASLSMGILLGALWAKEAWGHFWTWDPKETWALLTCLAYLTYIYYRTLKKNNYTVDSILLIIAFICLQMCWFGIKYLPSANSSIHLYN